MTMTAPATTHNLPTHSVSEISFALKRVVEDNFGYVRVRGEISGWRGAHSSGHAYFKLKDDKSVIEAVCWRGTLSKLQCRPEEGLEVIATGRITTYPGKSNYQIVIEAMEVAGVGALMAMLEKRKAQLESEGLFRPERKKPLPFLPAVIGIVTSPTGAVIRDILHRLQDRFGVRVLLWPVAVQGEGAAEQIAKAIRGFNQLLPQGALPKPELLIVARGGGSIEDLWAFNEEIVVRAAAESDIPLISAVGHETDTTLIDYASDRRAPTPTAAAEMAVPVREELWQGTSDLSQRLQAAMLMTQRRRHEQLSMLARALPKPAQVLEFAQQRFDDWSERLRTAMPALLMQKQQQLAIVTAKLKPQTAKVSIDHAQQTLTQLAGRMQQAVQRRLEQKEQAAATAAQLLAQLDYHRTLARGFVLVRNTQGRLVTSAASAKTTEMLELEFSDGKVKTKRE